MATREKVFKKDILALKLGEQKTFRVPHPKDIHNARAMASAIGTLEPELGLRFTVKSNFAKCEITIKAVKRHEE